MSIVADPFPLKYPILIGCYNILPILLVKLFYRREFWTNYGKPENREQSRIGFPQNPTGLKRQQCKSEWQTWKIRLRRTWNNFPARELVVAAVLIEEKDGRREVAIFRFIAIETFSILDRATKTD